MYAGGVWHFTVSLSVAVMQRVITAISLQEKPPSLTFIYRCAPVRTEAKCHLPISGLYIFNAVILVPE